MLSSSQRPHALAFRMRAVIALTITALALTLLPAAAAHATATSPTVEVPAEELKPIFSSLPVKDLGLSNTELGGLLSGIEGWETVSSKLGLFSAELLSEHPNATVEELVSGVMGDGLITNLLKILNPKLNLTSDQVFEALDPAQLSTLLGNLTPELTTGQLATLLSARSGNLSGPEELDSLQDILGGLTQALAPSDLEKLQGELQSLLAGLSKGELEPILQGLEPALSAGELPALQGLITELQSHTPAQLKTQLGTFLKSLSSTQTGALLEELPGNIGSSQLQTPFGELLASVPLSPTTAETLAGELGLSVVGLGEAFGTGVTPTTPMISGVLGTSSQLGMLAQTGTLRTSLLSALVGGAGKEPIISESEPEKGPEGELEGEGLESENLEGSGSKQQDPKSPAAGNEPTKQTGGSTGTGSSTETVNALLSTQSTTASTRIATNTTAKVKILGVRVKGKLLNVILAIPAAGRITLTGADLVRVSRNLPKSQRLVLKVRLRRAGLAIISSHKKRSRITLRVLFKPREGVSSVASAVVKVH